MWNDLVTWVEQHGGYVHPHLELRVGDTDGIVVLNHVDSHLHLPHHQHCQRGLFVASSTSSSSHSIIPRGEILIRLPRSTATINGLINSTTANNNQSRTTESTTITASPWLRCVAALVQAMGQYTYNKMKETRAVGDLEAVGRAEDDGMLPYMASLPTSYETIWQWSTEEIEQYLAGTTPTGIEVDRHQSTESNKWMIDPIVVRNKYKTAILPYFRQCGIRISRTTANNGTDDDDDDEGYHLFTIACQIISTRSFYMDHIKTQRNPTGDLDCDTNLHTGPYLLPVIDLINHADDVSGCPNAKLELASDDTFTIRALIDISPGTEILHSYGDHLSSHQFLMSFGFVPMNRMQRAATWNFSATSTTTICPVTISKHSIWESCWYLIESGLPQQLARIIEQSLTDDETWNVVVDRSRTAEFVPNDIVVVMSPMERDDAAADDDDDADVMHGPETILSDELVTAACIPFLPKCAYAEITSRTLLDRSILQDCYLGQLVGVALIRTIQQRLSLYRPIPQSTIQRLLPTSRDCDDNVAPVSEEDVQLLQRILLLLNTSSVGSVGSEVNSERRRLAYGLTIRIEEKATLRALGKVVAAELNCIETEHDEQDEGGDIAGTNEKLYSKKHKTNIE